MPRPSRRNFTRGGLPPTGEIDCMNDFAKFFFCISGFLGFAIFFLVALLIHGDASQALFYGASGCLLFSLSGRFLLGFALKGVVGQGIASPENNQPEVSAQKESSILTQEKITAERMTEAVANPKKSVVEAKV